MKHALPDGLHLHYEVYGPDDAPYTLVFLNGLSQSTLNWQPYVMAWRETYRMVLVDLIFQGQSDKTGDARTYDQHAADVVHLLDALNTERTVPVGISYGSGIAQHLLARYPERFVKGVLLSTFSYPTPLFEAIGEAWEKALQAGGYALMLNVMLPFVLGSTYFAQPLIPVAQLKQMRTGQELSAEALRKLMAGTAQRGDFRPALGEVRVPVLVLQGAEDLLCTPEMGRETAAAIPQGQCHVLPRVGHTLNFEAIPATLSLIDDFLRSTS